MTSEFEFTHSDYYTGPPATESLVQAAEQSLGVRLPSSYRSLIFQRNGGVPTRRRCPAPFRTSWAEDHFEIEAILGVGGRWGIDSDEQGSAAMIEEWEYPPVGVVICETPSAGPDTVMLDYRNVSGESEPAVVYIDEDREPRQVAATFQEFLNMLEPKQ